MSLSSLESVLKALADKNRLRIVALLTERKMCVCELASILGITQPSVSKHLKKLKLAGVIQSEQNGLWTDYLFSTDDPTVTSLFKIASAQLKADKTLREDQAKAKKADRNRLCCR